MLVIGNNSSSQPHLATWLASEVACAALLSCTGDFSLDVRVLCLITAGSSDWFIQNDLDDVVALANWS